MRGIIWGVLALFMLISMFWFAAVGGINVQTNILRLLPEDQSDPIAEQAFARFSERSMRELVFLLQAPQREQAVLATDELAEALTQSFAIERVEAGINANEQEAMAEFVYRFRHRLLSQEDRQRLQAGEFHYFAQSSLALLLSPVSGGLSQLLSSDPFLLSWRFASGAAESSFNTFSLDGNYLLAETKDGVHVLLRARLDGSAFDPTIQAEVMSLLETLEHRWQDDGNGVRLLRSGALFYADHGLQTAKHEISLIGGTSLVLVMLLVLFSFYSLSPLLLTALALLFGSGLGYTAVRFVFGEVHILTLVFGASLIGVAVDYAFHYFSLAGLAGNLRIRRILPAISLGLCSSLIAYAALASAPFPGLRQMALFCMAGLGGAWLSVVLLFPLLPANSRVSPFLLKLCHYWQSAVASKIARALLVVLLLTLPLVLLMLKDMRVEDDVRQFQMPDIELQEQEDELMRLLNAPAANQFYLVTGNDEQVLLENLERTAEVLDGLRAEGAITGYVNLANWMPSRARQQANYQRYAELYASDALSLMLDAGLLTVEDMAAARNRFVDDEGVLLDLEQWRSSVLGKQYDYLWLGKIDEQYAAVIPLLGIGQGSAALDVFENIGPDIRFVDKVGKVNDTIKLYRQRVGLLLAGVAAGIFLLLFLRYGMKHSIVIMASPLSAVLLALFGLHMLGEGLSLFNSLALFLVIGIGVDFGIFFAESGTVSEHTLLAVGLSALTTLLSFGMLSLSATPVIHSFGLTMLLGIGASLLLVPVLGQFTRQGSAEHRGS